MARTLACEIFGLQLHEARALPRAPEQHRTGLEPVRAGNDPLAVRGVLLAEARPLGVVGDARRGRVLASGLNVATAVDTLGLVCVGSGHCALGFAPS